MGLSTCGTIVGSSGESPEVLCDNGTGTGKVSVEHKVGLALFCDKIKSDSHICPSTGVPREAPFVILIILINGD